MPNIWTSLLWFCFFQTALCKIWAVGLKMWFWADHLDCPAYSYLYLWKRRLDHRLNPFHWYLSMPLVNIPQCSIWEMLGHCKTSNFFIPVFTTQVAWELQRIMAGQWILHDTSFHIPVDDDKHGGVVLSAPFLLNIYRSVLTLSFLSLIISLLKPKPVLYRWLECCVFLTHYKIQIGIYFSGYFQFVICRYIFRTEGLKAEQ